MRKLVLPLLAILLFTSCQKQIAKEEGRIAKEQIAPGATTENSGIISKKSDKIDVCHKAGPNNWQTINISIDAWPAHQAHGDVRLDDQDDDGYVLNNECGVGQMGDCDDNNPAINPATIWFKDNDNDGYSNGTLSTQCTQPIGYNLGVNLIATSGDCDDNNAAINSEATEICEDGIDNNCNGQIDENCIASVTICNQTWMLNNLDVTTYRDGTQIPQVTDPTAWAALTTGAWCYYGNNTANGTTYGKLYNWYAVAGIHDNDPNTPNKVLAPAGWHIPSDAEWTTLENCLDAISPTGNVGGKMKSTGTIQAGNGLWNEPNTNATNSSGFKGLPGGFRNNFGAFSGIGITVIWWSSSEIGSTSDAWVRNLRYNNGNLGRASGNKRSGYSVRCLRD